MGKKINTIAQSEQSCRPNLASSVNCMSLAFGVHNGATFTPGLLFTRNQKQGGILPELLSSVLVLCIAFYSCTSLIRAADRFGLPDFASCHCTWVHSLSMSEPACSDMKQNLVDQSLCLDFLIQCEWKKIPPCGFLTFFPNGWGHLFCTHLLYDPLYSRLQIFIQLFPNMTKLCNTKRDHPANFYISL